MATVSSKLPTLNLYLDFNNVAKLKNYHDTRNPELPNFSENRALIKYGLLDMGGTTAFTFFLDNRYSG